MKDEFLIKIVTIQDVEGEREILEMTTQATLNGENDDYSLTYVDETGDLAGCQTTLRVQNGNCVTIRREGSYNSHMIVEKNVRHISLHDTPYGSFALGISAKNIESKINNGKGSLKFKYATDVDMRPMGEIEFNITLDKRLSNHIN
ncbi:MAG: DUF1934 domain-containing protein [Clostridia bacterium]